MSGLPIMLNHFPMSSLAYENRDIPVTAEWATRALHSTTGFSFQPIFHVYHDECVSLSTGRITMRCYVNILMVNATTATPDKLTSMTSSFHLKGSGC